MQRPVADSERSTKDTVGLIPAAGTASRLPGLPRSKEILPLPGLSIGTGGGSRQGVMADCLLAAMAASRISRAYIILRQGKWDVPAHLGNGADIGLALAYLPLDSSDSIIETLDAAYPFVHDCRIALGFPDVLFGPHDALESLQRRQDAKKADVVLGLFPNDAPERSDMVETDNGGRVLRVRVKQPGTGLRHSWMLAVWTPVFTRLLHEAAEELRAKADMHEGELFPGHIVQRAVKLGLHVDSLTFDHGFCLDVGTPEGLTRALEMKPFPNGERP